jgi:hypothetical protein
MALLVFSDRCHYSQEIITIIKGEPSLQEKVRFWNVTTQGSPSPRITRVPTLVTDEGQMFVGADIKAWLQAAATPDIDAWDFAVQKKKTLAHLDENEPDKFFDFDSYGRPLQPKLTDELKSRIGKNVNDAYNSYNK